MARIEHLNITVKDPDGAANALCDLLGWSIRWSGAALGGGRSVHVGDDDTYLALYRPKGDVNDAGSSYATRHATNHIGIVVDDIDAAEARAKDLGYVPHNHGDYEPGRRFYIDGPEGLELELVAYD